MGEQPGPVADTNRSEKEATRLRCSVYTRRRIRAAKGSGVTYDEYLSWLIDTAAEVHGTADAPVVEKVGNNLIADSGEGE